MGGVTAEPRKPRGNIASLIPPFRFACIEPGVYRGAYPTLKNFRFLRRLELRTIVSLTPESKPNRDMTEFCSCEGVRNAHFRVERYQDHVTLTPSMVLAVLQLIIDPENLPVYIHCIDGTHNTGLLVMCLRKLQHWYLASITSEFCRWQRGGEITRDESQFLEGFRGEVELPPRIPPWLWGGNRGVLHPTFKLVLRPEDAAQLAGPPGDPPPGAPGEGAEEGISPGAQAPPTPGGVDSDAGEHAGGGGYSAAKPPVWSAGAGNGAAGGGGGGGDATGRLQHRKWNCRFGTFYHSSCEGFGTFTSPRVRGLGLSPLLCEGFGTSSSWISLLHGAF
mmetsp:Transcript_71389/g.225459  ORF Transcript_71389/g.225459 Transcript_71389/m.225459 type:complete len:334 (+) Transcript_71389:233-1234(+)